MTSTDGVPAQIESPGLVNAVGGVDGPERTLEETSPPREGLQPSDAHLRPVEDLHSLLLRIGHHLDFETSERTTIYHRLRALDEQTRKIVKQTKRPRLRAVGRYLTAIVIGIATTLAWQAYGGDAEHVIATRAPELGWSPQSKQLITSFVQEFGWTKEPAQTDASIQAPQVAPVAEALAASAPPAPGVDPEQVHEIQLTVAAMRQSLDQIASGQDQMAHEITRLQSADAEILAKIPAPPRQPAVAPAHKPVAAAPSGPSRAPLPVR